MHELIDIAIGDRPASDDPASRALRAFCRDVSAIVDSVPVEDVPRRIASLMPDLLATPRLLTEQQCSAPTDGYGRNRIFICPADRFSVLAMVWPAGVSTPIHDHRDWCAFGVYEGAIEETHFAASGGNKAVARRTIRHRMGGISHLPVNAPNIHRIHNPTDTAAISIHVYGGNCETRGPNLDRVYTLDP